MPAHCRGIEYFNPRSREGSDALRQRNCSTPEISIHAPVKGATVGFCRCGHFIHISIHAPVKGATTNATIPFQMPIKFQSTLP